MNDSSGTFAAVDGDRALFRLVYELMHEGQAAQHSGRGERRAPREPYPCLQPIAPLVPGQPLDAAEFRPVRCFDLSASGFSFLARRPPDTPGMIVALGTPPEVIYMNAEVMHETPLVLIGCRFMGRSGS
jgi:hypothetical protein